MKTKFMSDTPLAKLEMEMQMIPGFQSRRSGITVRRFADISAGGHCPCVTEKVENDKTCQNGIICFVENRVMGGDRFLSLLSKWSDGAGNIPFVSNVSFLVGSRRIPFADEQHLRRFQKLWEKHQPVPDEDAMCAAIYLLTADSYLWGKSVTAIKPELIDFSMIQIHGVDLYGYVLFYAAKDIYKGTSHISLSELIDPELVNERVFQLITTAFLIRRHGAVVLCGKGE